MNCCRRVFVPLWKNSFVDKPGKVILASPGQSYFRTFHGKAFLLISKDLRDFFATAPDQIFLGGPSQISSDSFIFWTHLCLLDFRLNSFSN